MAANKKISTCDLTLSKYIVDCIAKNPLSFIPIIESIMDPKNPDSKKLTQTIGESITKSILDNKKLKDLCLKRILENINSCTDQEIFKIVNDQRISLEKDSREFIKEIQKQTTITLCEKYFKKKQEIIDQIFDDYFKKLSDIIKKDIAKLEEKVNKVAIEEADKNSVMVHVPNSLKNKVVEYVQFLQSKE